MELNQRVGTTISNQIPIEEKGHALSENVYPICPLEKDAHAAAGTYSQNQ